MVPGSLGQQMRAKASFGMASAPPAQHVQQVMTALMQGQTIPLTYGRWVQWDQTSWVGSMQTYRYGVLNGLQVEMDFAQVGLMLRRPVVPGVTHSLALQGNVMAAPKTGLTRESTGEEEAAPEVPFEHGMVQPGKKPPPAAWFQRQGMQNWMNRMAAPAKPPPVVKEGGMYNPYVAVPKMGPPGPQQMPGPPPPDARTASTWSTSNQGLSDGGANTGIWFSSGTSSTSSTDNGDSAATAAAAKHGGKSDVGAHATDDD